MLISLIVANLETDCQYVKQQRKVSPSDMWRKGKNTENTEEGSTLSL
jgi:hypothetical protein